MALFALILTQTNFGKKIDIIFALMFFLYRPGAILRICLLAPNLHILSKRSKCDKGAR